MQRLPYVLSPLYRLATLACWAMLVSTPALVHGQFWRQTGVQLEAGPSFFNLNALNEALKPDRYPELPNAFFALGFSSMRMQNKFLYGFSLYNFVGAQRSDLNITAMLNHHYFMPRIGGVFLKRPDAHAYFAAGAGGGLTLLRLKPANSQVFSRRWTNGFLFEGLIGAQLSNPVQASTGTEFIFLSGISIGYTATLANSFGLSFDGQDGPVVVAPTGPFVRLTLGMAGRR